MKILIALLAGLLIGLCAGWQLGRTRQVAAPEKVFATRESTGTSSAWSGSTMLDVLECHDKVVAHGVETLILPKEVESLFGTTNVDHFISSFESKMHTPVWNSVTYFGGRYTFALQVPISIDYESCKVKGAVNSATVHLNEVTEVEISTSGGAGATLKGGIGPNRGELNENEWKWLVKNNGDWSVVRVPILTNAPAIKNFDEYVRQARGLIRNRKEGFDKPVRQALESLRKRQSVPNANDSPANE